MSGPDQERDDKGFLARWSQRKQEANKPVPDTPPAGADAAAEPAAAAEAPPEFDLASLPKLEDLTPSTDITAFLRKGVPEHLRNAALRKSWALDPAIRNYVNPALDYAYDWNTPGGVPGNGEIGAGMDVARLVSQIMGTDEARAESAADASVPNKEDVTGQPLSPEPAAAPDLPTEALRLSDATVPETKTTSASEAEAVPPPRQEENPEQDSAAPQQSLRRHGSAKPVV